MKLSVRFLFVLCLFFGQIGVAADEYGFDDIESIEVDPYERAKDIISDLEGADIEKMKWAIRQCHELPQGFEKFCYFIVQKFKLHASLRNDALNLLDILIRAGIDSRRMMGDELYNRSQIMNLRDELILVGYSFLDVGTRKKNGAPRFVAAPNSYEVYSLASTGLHIKIPTGIYSPDGDVVTKNPPVKSQRLNMQRDFPELGARHK